MGYIKLVHFVQINKELEDLEVWEVVLKPLVKIRGSQRNPIT